MTQQFDWSIQPTRLQPNRLLILWALFRQPIIVAIKCIFRHFIKLTEKSSKLTYTCSGKHSCDLQVAIKIAYNTQCTCIVMYISKTKFLSNNSILQTNKFLKFIHVYR